MKNTLKLTLAVVVATSCGHKDHHDWASDNASLQAQLNQANADKTAAQAQAAKNQQTVTADDAAVKAANDNAAAAATKAQADLDSAKAAAAAAQKAGDAAMIKTANDNLAAAQKAQADALAAKAAAEKNLAASAADFAAKLQAANDAAAKAADQAKKDLAAATVAATNAQAGKDAATIKDANDKLASAQKAASDAAAAQAKAEAASTKAQADLTAANAAAASSAKATVSNYLSSFDGIWIAPTAVEGVATGCTVLLNVQAKDAQITRGIACQNGNLETATYTVSAVTSGPSFLSTALALTAQVSATPTAASCAAGTTSTTGALAPVSFDLGSKSGGEVASQAYATLGGKDMALSSYGFFGTVVHTSDCASITTAAANPANAGLTDSNLTAAAAMCNLAKQKPGCFTASGFTASAQ